MRQFQRSTQLIRRRYQSLTWLHLTQPILKRRKSFYQSLALFVFITDSAVIELENRLFVLAELVQDAQGPETQKTSICGHKLILLMNSTIERMNRNQFPIYRLHLQVSKCVLFIQELKYRMVKNQVSLNPTHPLNTVQSFKPSKTRKCSRS